MTNKIFRDRFKQQIQAAILEAENASLVKNAGMAGHIREILVEKILRPALSPEVAIGTGKITDVNGALSSQCDVIIYSPCIIPPILHDQRTGIFPVESCFYAIEVKSTLTAQAVRDAVQNAISLWSLHYLPGRPSPKSQPTVQHVSPVIPALFAFATDLSTEGKSEIDRYREYDVNADTGPIIPVICVRGRGYWWFRESEPGVKWIHHLATENYDEVIDFVGGVANTIPDKLVERGHPRLGNYLIEPRPFDKL